MAINDLAPLETNVHLFEFDSVHAAVDDLHGVLGVTDRKLVSMDFNHDPRSAIFASDQTAVQQGNLLRVLVWYDNKWGFSNRMLDTAAVMGAPR